MKLSGGGIPTFLVGILAVVAWLGGTVAGDDLTSVFESETVMHLPALQDSHDIAMRDSPSSIYFDKSTPLNVTAQQGKTAYLHCQVRNLSNKTVSWVRRRDLHILTVGRYTYITDQRFQAYHLADSDDWTLQIRYTQPRDAGVYECQVSTEPKMSILITLNVVVPKSVIQGGPDLHVKTGSTITLQCLITESPEPPVFIFWYHENKVLNYDTPRRTIRVETMNSDMTISKLLITNAQSSDSGNYTCSPSNADQTSIIVHVLNGRGVQGSSSTEDLDNTMLSDTLIRGEKHAGLQIGKHSSSAHHHPEDHVVVFVLFSALWIICHLGL